jgi:hypothetical protein
MFKILKASSGFAPVMASGLRLLKELWISSVVYEEI